MTKLKKSVTKEGSVRVDLVGGTLDLEPIASLIRNTVTINMATALMAKVIVEETSDPVLEIFSSDYQKRYIYSQRDLSEDNFYQNNLVSNHFFQEMLFVVMICKHFGVTKNVVITLSSGAPAGSGLGGSSAMGVTLARALLSYTGKTLEVAQIVQEVRTMEEVILNRGVAGYQDYYPALCSGVLAIRPHPSKHLVEQCYSSDLADFLAKNITLVYSGQSRNSGINNWEVFKSFFDEPALQEKATSVRGGLSSIAIVAAKAYQAIKAKNHKLLLSCIAEEGTLREKLFTGIVTPAMKSVDQECRTLFSSYEGLKVCGAGGGGCFLLVGVSSADVKSLLEAHGMSVLPLEVLPPFEDNSGNP